MKIALGADHRGYELKELIKKDLLAAGETVEDFGTDSTAPCDYPDFALAVGKAIMEKKADVGIVVCGSGVGACVAVNKIPGVRAGICHDTFSAHQGREDDDTNVLCLGSRIIGPALAMEVTKAFLNARFSGAERHVRRLKKVEQIEKEYSCYPTP